MGIMLVTMASFQLLVIHSENRVHIWEIFSAMLVADNYVIFLNTYQIGRAWRRRVFHFHNNAFQLYTNPKWSSTEKW